VCTLGVHVVTECLCHIPWQPEEDYGPLGMLWEINPSPAVCCCSTDSHCISMAGVSALQAVRVKPTERSGVLSGVTKRSVAVLYHEALPGKGSIACALCNGIP
jgi:hypothetical protein